MRPVRCSAAWALVCGTLAGATTLAMGQLTERPIAGVLTHPAIGYYTTPTHDLVADLNRRIDEGSASVAFDAGTGYLRTTLAALHVPVESQMLVMSKTGIQGLHTTPDNPRAIYFNDAVTVGYIRGAPLLELAVQDPRQGVVFYTIDQRPQPHAVFERRKDCLQCHQVLSTLHVPGMLARSIFMGRGGVTLGFGTYDADDRTPFRRRWGGWYVTGTHGGIRHMGNAIITNTDDRESGISERTLNRTSLDGLFDAHDYPSAQSDIVALMVFQHQVHMMNLIARIGWEARVADANGQLDVSRGALKDGVDEFVDYTLFVDEQPLTDAIAGTSGFAEIFAAQGPTDRRGRSLRQLDLQRRLLRYPCSYMIYSEAFRALPDRARDAIYGRMWEILSGRDAQPKYARLSDADRRAVLEILGDTISDWPKQFQSARSASIGSTLVARRAGR
jgi:hypothetical protein